MLDVFMYSANAVLPIVLLIGLGWVLRQRGFYDEKFLQTANKLVFRVTLPVMIYVNIYDIGGLGDIKWDVVLYGVAAVLLLFFLGLATVLLFVKEKGSRGVIVQCVFRSNFAIIGLPLSLALGGETGMQVTSVMTAFTIPLFNILAVIALSVFAGENAKKRTPWQVIKGILKNPLIHAAALGLLTLAVRSLIPEKEAGVPAFSIQNNLPFLYSVLRDTSKATTFLAFIVLGGLLDFTAIRGKLNNILLGTLWRVILAPAVGLSGAVLLTKLGVLSCGPGEYACFIAMFGAPVAFSSAIMAAEMDGDAELARQLVVWTSVASMVTIFAITSFFRALGLL